jgi:hypothetical protein
MNERITNTSLYKQKEELGIEYAWNTEKYAAFTKCETDYLIEDYVICEYFGTGEIRIIDSENKEEVLVTQRVLNLMRLGI